MKLIRTCKTDINKSKDARYMSVGFAALFALAALGLRPVQETATSKPTQTLPDVKWVSVSDDVIKQLTANGKK